MRHRNSWTAADIWKGVKKPSTLASRGAGANFGNSLLFPGSSPCVPPPPPQQIRGILEDEWTRVAFPRCILIQVPLPRWVRGRTASSCTPASTFPCLALNYITWHVFRNLVWVAETPSGLKCQLSILNTHGFSKDEIPACWNCDGREREDRLILCKGWFQVIGLNSLLTPAFIVGWIKQPELAWVLLCWLWESSSAGIC